MSNPFLAKLAAKGGEAGAKSEEKKKKEEEEKRKLKIFHIPPDIGICKTHQQASLLRSNKHCVVGEEETCICCNKKSNTQFFPICCKPDELSEFGNGLSMLFTLAKLMSILTAFLMLFAGILAAFYLTGGFIGSFDTEFIAELVSKFPVYMTYILYPTMVIVGDEQLYIMGLIICVLSTFLFFAWIRVTASIKDQAVALDVKDLSIADYTIMINNLPTDKSFNQDDFMEEMFYNRGINKEDIVRISFVFDIREMLEEAEELHELNEKKSLLENSKKSFVHYYPGHTPEEFAKALGKDFDHKLEEVMHEIKHVQGEIQHENEAAKLAELERSPFVFITFKFTDKADEMLERFEKGGEQVKYNGREFTAVKPAEPSDISWEGLPVPPSERAKKQMMTMFWMVLILVVAGIANYFIHMALEENIAEGLGWYQDVLGEVPSAIVIVCINIILAIAIEILTEKEMIETHTGEEISIGVKTTFAMLVNSAFVPMLLSIVAVHHHGGGSAWEYVYSPKGFVHKVFFVWITIAIIEPMIEWIPLFGPGMLKRFFIRCKGKNNKICQIQANKIFTPPLMEIPVKYGYLVFLFFYSCFSFPVYPAGSLFTMLALLIGYNVDKYMTLRQCQKPHPISHEIALYFVTFAGYGIAILIVSNALFMWLLCTRFNYLNIILGLILLLLLFGTRKVLQEGGMSSLPKCIRALFDENAIIEEFEDQFKGIPYDILGNGRKDYMFKNPITKKEGLKMCLDLEFKSASKEHQKGMEGMFKGLANFTTMGAMQQCNDDGKKGDQVTMSEEGVLGSKGMKDNFAAMFSSSYVPPDKMAKSLLATFALSLFSSKETTQDKKKEADNKKDEEPKKGGAPPGGFMSMIFKLAQEQEEAEEKAKAEKEGKAKGGDMV